MPTYQYACTECGYGFDAIQSFTDDALTECPQCLGRLRKVFGAVGIVFKGSGFYRNDSRDAGKASSDGDLQKDKAGKASEGATSDSKPAESTKPAAAKAATSSSTGGSGSSSSAAASTGGSSGSAA